MAVLSEHEKRQFRLIEQRLKADDPKFFKSMRMASTWHRPKALLYRPKSRNLFLSIIAVVLGILILSIGNALLANPAVAVQVGQTGILIAGLGIYGILTICHRNSKEAKLRGNPEKTFMANLESRWKKSYQARWDQQKKNGLL